MTNQQNDKEKEVTITLKKWQVEKLLGAARMGIWVEDWCFHLRCSDSGWTDTRSGKWILRVGYIIDQIKKQTRADYEDKAYGRETNAVEKIDELVFSQCEEWRIRREEAERIEYEEYKKTHPKPGAGELKVFRTKIKPEILKYATDFADSVQKKIDAGKQN